MHYVFTVYCLITLRTLTMFVVKHNVCLPLQRSQFCSLMLFNIVRSSVRTPYWGSCICGHSCIFISPVVLLAALLLPLVVELQFSVLVHSDIRVVCTCVVCMMYATGGGFYSLSFVQFVNVYRVRQAFYILQCRQLLD